MSELDLNELFHRLKKRLGMIIFITLLIAGAAFVVSYFVISPKYEAKISIIIGKEDTSKETTSSDVTMYQSLMQTYRSIAMTNMVAENAASKLKSIETEDLLKNTTVTTESGTMIMSIAVRDGNPELAHRAVEAYGASFIDRAGELMPSGEVTIMDSSKVPTEAVSPNVKLNVAIGFMVGLMGSVGLALLLEHFKNTLVTIEDVERNLGITVIGIIPEREED
ncbi:MAG: capsular polysaccharide biosynthesis protein [Fusobacteria bacterium]|nr:MAG: capsular polysaccharide biosynthesis protein [Fusobacteriota bacterium]KAF0229241.1 MAG: capsular polysaccharide biosynthesis [Fusobacteriota bacterium]